jgi:hypothetical protein
MTGLRIASPFSLAMVMGEEQSDEPIDLSFRRMRPYERQVLILAAACLY